MGAIFGGWLNRRRDDRAQDSKLYRTISTISIIGLFVCVVLFVFGIMQIIKFNAILIGIIGTIGCLCLGCVLMLPWIRRLEHKELKVVSLVFIGLNALVPILWIASIWIIIGVSKQGSFSVGLANFLKTVLIISLQFIVASYIATGITKYKKTMIVFQTIAYACYLYVDFIFTYLFCCIKFGGESLVSISSGITLLSSVWIWAIFVIALIFMGIANGIMYRSDLRKIRNAAEDVYVKETDKEKTNDEKANVEEQLSKLKELLDKNLITEEEYNKKRSDIIDKM